MGREGAILLLSVYYLLVSLNFRRTFWRGYSFTFPYNWMDTWYLSKNRTLLSAERRKRPWRAVRWDMLCTNKEESSNWEKWEDEKGRQPQHAPPLSLCLVLPWLRAGSSLPSGFAPLRICQDPLFLTKQLKRDRNRVSPAAIQSWSWTEEVWIALQKGFLSTAVQQSWAHSLLVWLVS